MRKIYAYFISIQLMLSWSGIQGQELPDTVEIPLKIRAGIEVTGPIVYSFDKNILNMEGNLSMDLNEKISVFLAGGYSDFKYSQYNYSFLGNGIYFKAGADINLMKPKKSEGKYWAGIGFHYGLSLYGTEIPSFGYENYWGAITSSVGQERYIGHFIEAAPGFRADIFKYFTIGWSVTLRKLISAGTGKDLRPVNFPGYGNGVKSVSTGINYFIIFNIPYKKIRVIIEPEPVEETEEGVTQTP